MGFFEKLFSKKSSENSKNQTIESFEDFWKWFSLHSDEFYQIIVQGNEIETKFFDPLSQALGQINKHIYYLVGINSNNKAELIFTAEGVVKHFPIVEKLVSLAPQMEKWDFITHKPASDMNRYGIKMGDYSFSEEKIQFFVTNHEAYPDLIDINLVYSDYSDEDKEVIINGCFIYLDNFLGELTFASVVDDIRLVASVEPGTELIPISKLKEYLVWREKEFVEKYEATRKNTENDNYTGLEATLQSGAPLIALINQDLMAWDAKPSHPWIFRIDMGYVSDNDSGMPNQTDYELMDVIEDYITTRMQDRDGYLNIGRQTADGLREVFFACRDFRKPVFLMIDLQKEFAHRKLKIDYTIYKDKYWKTLDFFMPTID